MNMHSAEDGTALGERFKAGDLDVVEAAEQALRRARTLEAAGVFITLTGERAIREAETAPATRDAHVVRRLAEAGQALMDEHATVVEAEAYQRYGHLLEDGSPVGRGVLRRLARHAARPPGAADPVRRAMRTLRAELQRQFVYYDGSIVLLLAHGDKRGVSSAKFYDRLVESAIEQYDVWIEEG